MADAGPTPRPVRASYRVQLRDGTTLYDVAARVPDIARLGASHLHLSPVLAAVPGSAHGYDVVDHDRVDGALGGEPAFEELVSSAAAHGLGIVVDIVPNHMAADPRANRRWWDVLALGAASADAPLFDIDWDETDRLLVPRLGEHYADAVDGGRIGLARRDSGIDVLVHDDLSLPVAPDVAALVVEHAARAVADTRAAALARALAELASRPASPAELRVDRDELWALLCEHLRDHPSTADAVDRRLAVVAGDSDLLDDLLESQHWRLAHWRAGTEDLGYRRFFDVDGLVGLRVEDPAVFDATHATVARWVASGAVDGVRVDHPDGLADPIGYAVALRRLAPTGWISVEKILEGDEHLDRRWPVDGTTGYDAAARITDLLVDGDGLASMTGLWCELTGGPAEFADVVHEARLDVLARVLQPEVGRLVSMLGDVGRHHRVLRDRTSAELEVALVALLACFPVYRTYVVEGPPSEEEAAAIARATEEVRTRHPDVDGALLDLLVAVLSDATGAAVGSPRAAAERRFRVRFQQVSGPAMAKGKEDTALYRHAPCAARCEVGADPGTALGGPADLHAWAARTVAEHPRTMSVLSTHDTKRSGDVRAGIAAISHDPGPFAEVVRAAMGERRESRPAAATELLVWQTAVAVWPIDHDRLWGRALKAAREAKTATSWLEPDDVEEAALEAFVASLHDDPDRRVAVEALADHYRAAGRRLSLAATLLHLTAAGVPDVYQGTEMWDDSLVDPDNRRPVDVGRIRAALDEVDRGGPVGALGDLDAADDPGLDKLALTVRALALRARLPGCFGPGAGHEPIAVDAPGDGGERRAIAYRRGDDVVAVAWLRPFEAPSGAVDLPPGTWVDQLAGSGRAGPTAVGTHSGRADLSAVLATAPVALLARQVEA